MNDMFNILDWVAISFGITMSLFCIIWLACYFYYYNKNY